MATDRIERAQRGFSLEETLLDPPLALAVREAPAREHLEQHRPIGELMLCEPPPRHVPDLVALRDESDQGDPLVAVHPVVERREGAVGWPNRAAPVATKSR